MILSHLHLHSFRAHTDTRLELAPGVNLFHGPNGAGKTNVLEAVHYLCLSKSFLTSTDTYALRRGAPYFEVDGLFATTRRPQLRVRLVYVPEEGKRLFVNGAPLPRLSDVVGLLPAVVFSPEDQALTAGGPEERRRFLNNILSQARPVYLDDLLKYGRALKQRNELLFQQRRGGAVPPELLDSWTEELVVLAARVVVARLHFITEFTAFLARAYAEFEHVAEQPSITYEGLPGLAPGATEEEVTARLRAELARTARRERQMGRTLVGPHRDELLFRLDAFEVRRYASQGQHRTFGLALKLAQYFYLQDRLEEHPILLLDDIFDNLDPQRTAAFLALLQTDRVGQSLITAPRRAPFDPVVSFDGPEHAAHEILPAATGTL